MRQVDEDPSLETARQLLTRQLLYTACAYSRIHLCIQGSPSLHLALEPMLHSLTQHACTLGVSLSLLTSRSSDYTKVRHVGPHTPLRVLLGASGRASSA